MSYGVSLAILSTRITSCTHLFTSLSIIIPLGFTSLSTMINRGVVVTFQKTSFLHPKIKFVCKRNHRAITVLIIFLPFDEAVVANLLCNRQFSSMTVYLATRSISSPSKWGHISSQEFHKAVKRGWKRVQKVKLFAESYHQPCLGGFEVNVYGISVLWKVCKCVLISGSHMGVFFSSNHQKQKSGSPEAPL